MHYLQIQKGLYQTPTVKRSLLSQLLPSLMFYPKFLGVVFRASGNAKRGLYTNDVWIKDSLRVLQLLEVAGVKVSLSGMENLEKLDGPCVFIGNHMSIMETVIMPVMILPYTNVTYVVKESLLTYPIFKHIMISIKPVAVTRTNPRQDLKTVMSEGVERLAEGTAVIVFPQTTRSTDFDPAQFGSIGIKLAKKANVPIIPVALKTDAWQNGKYSKDFGKISPQIPVHFAFGEALQVSGKGTEEHEHVVQFIGNKLKEWQ